VTADRIQPGPNEVADEHNRRDPDRHSASREPRFIYGRDGHAAEPATQPAVGVRRQRQPGSAGDTIGYRRHLDRVGPDVLGEFGFAQLLEAIAEFVHSELLAAQQQILQTVSAKYPGSTTVIGAITTPSWLPSTCSRTSNTP
jgi:hypothetical protein